MQTEKTTLINTAVIVMGAYHVPVAVAFGAIVGASVFILSSDGYSVLNKAWLFACTFLVGIFAGADAASFINLVKPGFIAFEVSPFAAAALASALSVKGVQTMFWCIDNKTLSFWKKGGTP